MAYDSFDLNIFGGEPAYRQAGKAATNQKFFASHFLMTTRQALHDMQISNNKYF